MNKTMTDINRLLTPLRETSSDNKFHSNIPDQWQQGRGCFGGLVIAQLIRAMGDMEEDRNRQLRNISAQIIAPVLVGSAVIEVETLRRGNGVSLFAARLVQDGEVRAFATGTFARERTNTVERTDLMVPEIVPREGLPSLEAMQEMMPNFARHFRFLLAEGIPFQTGQSARTSGWVQCRYDVEKHDAAYMAMMADCWWPTLFSVLAQPRPCATLTFSFDMVADEADVQSHNQFFHSGQMLVAHAGYFIEQRLLFSPSGKLLCINLQTMAVIR